MVEVEFDTLKKLVVHEVIEHEVKDLVKLRVLGLRQDSVAQALVWAEGVLFTRNAMLPTAEIVKQQLQGIIHFTAVEFALMKKYKKTLTSEGVKIPVIDVSKNPSLRDLAKALKKRHKES